MKTTFRKATIAGVLSLVAIGAVSASAAGFGGMMTNLTPDEIAAKHSAMFQSEAALIGASLEEVKQAWADGKDFKTLAAEKGVTEAQLQAKMKVKRDEEMKSQLANLVSKGVITQAQADKRLMTTQTREATGKKGKHGMTRVFGL